MLILKWITHRVQELTQISKLDTSGEQRSTQHDSAKEHSGTFVELVKEREFTADQIYNAMRLPCIGDACSVEL